MEKIWKFYSKYKLIISLILLGVILRFVASVFFTHIYDFSINLALTKSVADTGRLSEGFINLGQLQVYGKIFYQVNALWFLLLDKLNVLDTRYIFDLHPYQLGQGYLKQYPYLGPEVYQIAAFKLVNLFYDFLLLFFLIKTANLLNFKKIKTLFLFWAINPIFIYIGYVIFQSDFAMFTFLTGGIYFMIKSIKNKNSKYNLINKFAAILLFSLGAIIKQVPLLVIPFTFILFAENFLQFVILFLFFVMSYFTFYQSWSSDGFLMKKYFLTSTESMALFDFSLNGLNIFFTFYLGLLAFFFSIKERVKKNPIFILYLVTLILSIIYISENSASLFVQFNVWIMPFLALLALHDKNFALFLIAPVIGFYKRAMVDNSVLIGNHAITFGEPLNKIPQYTEFVGKFMNPDLVLKFMGNLITLSYILLVIYILYAIMKQTKFQLIEQINRSLKINLLKASIGIFLIFTLIAFVEYTYTARYSQLTNFSYAETSDKNITRKPLVISIDNEKGFAITSIVIKILAKDVLVNDYTVFKITDKNTNKLLSINKVEDFMLKNPAGILDLQLSNSVNSKKMKLEIFKENNVNNIVVYQAKDYSIKQSEYSSRYDNFYNKNYIKLGFEKNPIVINLRGSYTLQSAFDNLSYHVNKKPTFYKAYFGFIIILISIILFSLKSTYPLIFSKIKKTIKRKKLL